MVWKSETTQNTGRDIATEENRLTKKEVKRTYSKVQKCENTDRKKIKRGQHMKRKKENKQRKG
jgi:hypothetical protein